LKIAHLSASLAASILVMSVLAQSAHASPAINSTSNSWVDIQVISFDGDGITAAITLSITGNHENASVRIWGESSGNVGTNTPCPTVICVTSSVGFAIGRIIREVAFSSETNITTFHYAARFVWPNYQANTILGMPPFPVDAYTLNLVMTTDFKADIDAHPRVPILPTPNYDGTYQVTDHGLQDNQYSYGLVLRIFHHLQFIILMLLLTWGTILLLGVLTGSLLFRPPERRDEKNGDTATVCSAIIVFVPVFELSLQAFKSPLTITPSDFFVFVLLVGNVYILLRRARSSLDEGLPQVAKQISRERDVNHTSKESSAVPPLGQRMSKDLNQEEVANIKRILIEHDFFSSLDTILLLYMPLATLGVSVVPHLLGLPFAWHYLAAFVAIATVVLLVSVALLARAKLAGSGSATSISGRAEAWAFPFIFLIASASSLLMLAITDLVLGVEISLGSLALAAFGGVFLGNALSSYPTKWLARRLKDRMPWRSDEIENLFSTTPFVRLSYRPGRWVLIQSLIGLALLFLYVLTVAP
jgi:hypothetical protein